MHFNCQQEINSRQGAGIYPDKATGRITAITELIRLNCSRGERALGDRVNHPNNVNP